MLFFNEKVRIIVIARKKLEILLMVILSVADGCELLCHF